MGQVPVYGVVGSGRLAKHVAHYLRLLNLQFKTWSRSEFYKTKTTVEESLAGCDVILLLISDGAIKSFHTEHYTFLKDKKVIHMSGALSIDGIDSFHPVMTFGRDLYELSFYEKIPFVAEAENRSTFQEVFPALNNPYFAISKVLKAKYHSLLVMVSNFPNLLWQKAQKDLSEEMKLPETILGPIILKTAENFIQDPTGSLTGPLARKDLATIEKNLKALDGDRFQKVYSAFKDSYEITH